jgi:hypothetical protein
MGFDAGLSGGGTCGGRRDFKLVPRRGGCRITQRRRYGGTQPPLRDITTGDIWFFNAKKAYDQATGVGVPDVANLPAALRALD